MGPVNGMLLIVFNQLDVIIFSQVTNGYLKMSFCLPLVAVSISVYSNDVVLLNLQSQTEKRVLRISSKVGNAFIYVFQVFRLSRFLFFPYSF